MANKRTIIREAIKANPGELTKAQLMELAEVNAAGFASQLSYLRMSGVFPVMNDDGKFILITEEDWEAHKADRASGKETVDLTPEEMLAKLEKKASRAASAQTNAAKKAKDSRDDIDKLKAKRAELDLKICEMELGRFQAENPDVVSTSDA
jgi:DNA-directed RNA polymerase delta subunit